MNGLLSPKKPRVNGLVDDLSSHVTNISSVLISFFVLPMLASWVISPFIDPVEYVLHLKLIHFYYAFKYGLVFLYTLFVTTIYLSICGAVSLNK